MTKPVRQLTQCEQCGEDIDIQSPPLREYYKHGRIDIGDHSTVLLDRKDAPGAYHSSSLEGLYCNVECLVARIKWLRANAGRPTNSKPDRG